MKAAIEMKKKPHYTFTHSLIQRKKKQTNSLSLSPTLIYSKQ